MRDRTMKRLSLSQHALMASLLDEGDGMCGEHATFSYDYGEGRAVRLLESGGYVIHHKESWSFSLTKKGAEYLDWMRARIEAKLNGVAP